ncbi:MAG: nitroreductase family protein [Synergistota bacterium]|nr:nitroreductase family protein [Synergistota bacterium]
MRESLENGDVLAIIRGRRSIRRFKNTPVEPEMVESMIECALAAPSAGNSRPAHLVVVDDPKVLKNLDESTARGRMLYSAPLAVVVCADPSRSELAAMYWEQDCSAAMQNLLLAAHAMGLAGVWLGVRHDPAREKALRGVLDIPESVHVLGIAAVGRPAETRDTHKGVEPGCLHVNRW